MKEVEFGEVEASELRVKPNLPVLGPKLGKELGATCARRCRPASSRSSTTGASASAGTSSRPDEVLVERRGREGWAVASEPGLTVAFDTTLDDGAATRGPRARPDPPGERDAPRGRTSS